ELEPRGLVDRKRVHVRTQREHSPGPRAAETRDDARPRRPLELEPVERAQRLLDEGRRLDFLERELGVRVKVPPPRDRLLLELGRDEPAHWAAASSSAAR